MKVKKQNLLLLHLNDSRIVVSHTITHLTSVNTTSSSPLNGSGVIPLVPVGEGPSFDSSFLRIISPIARRVGSLMFMSSMIVDRPPRVLAVKPAYTGKVRITPKNVSKEISLTSWLKSPQDAYRKPANASSAVPVEYSNYTVRETTRDVKTGEGGKQRVCYQAQCSNSRQMRVQFEKGCCRAP